MACGLNCTCKQPAGYSITSCSVKSVDFAVQAALQPLTIVYNEGSNNKILFLKLLECHYRFHLIISF